MDTWKVVVVDDEKDVHTVTNLALKRVEFEGKKLSLISAMNTSEAKTVFKNNTDIAVVILDIIMEDENSGLELIKYIREDLNNKMTQIIIRTGQPGKAPEEKITLLYDIND